MDRIRIVFFQHHLVCGGAEQALFDLIGLLDKTRFDITVLVLQGGGEWESKFREAGVSVINIFEKRKRTGSLFEYLNDWIRDIKIHCLMWFRPEKLVGYFAGNDIDVCVGYSLMNHEKIVMAANTKHIKYIHGNVETNYYYGDDMLEIKHILPKYHKIVCVSQESFQAFKRMIGVKDNVEMHFNPINSDHVRHMAEATVDVPKDVPYICAVGRLSPEKGYDRLIRVHQRVLDQGYAHKLVIVGDGPEKDNLLGVIQETGTTESVILTGYQENPYPYMKHSRFVVCSSFSEGLPVISMEALALGVPMVSTAPSIADAFGDDCCGIITENNTDDSLESGIRKMLDDSEFYELAKQGARNRSKFYDGNRMVKEIENLFIEVAKGK